MLLKALFVYAALSGAVSVILGAFGAHALKGSLESRLLDAFETGVTYQMTHALVMLVVLGLALVWDSRAAFLIAAAAFAVGMLLFSGSLYLLALTGMKWLGPVTPIGGVFLIAGWFTFAWALATQEF